ncbi:MAG: hypothetical protein LBN43_02075 [Oscillospiraceae bacterium]|jgi:diacylglycerol kinase family enzyme|nr:hypothetical protein [Oscillospiraceae bacterium]
MLHLFVINPKSFRSTSEVEAVVTEIIQAFSKNHEPYKVYMSRAPRDAIGAINKYVEAAPRGETVRVYAVGGDGILFDCINGIIGLPNAEITNVPYGNSNDFLLSFGERSYPSFSDIQLLAYSPTTETDVLYCGNTHAINCCCIGIEASAILKTASLLNILGKTKVLHRLIPAVYFCGEIIAAIDSGLRRQKYTVIIDGEFFGGVFGVINIGNGSHNAGGRTPQPYALPNDGLLDVILYKSSSVFNALRIVGPYLRGNFEHYPDNFIYRRAKRIEVRSEQPLPIVIDGETFYDTFINVEVMPKAVNFITPPGMTYRTAADEPLGAKLKPRKK